MAHRSYTQGKSLWTFIYKPLPTFIEKPTPPIQKNLPTTVFPAFLSQTTPTMTTKTFLLAALCSFSLCTQGQTGLQGEYFNGQQFEQKMHTRSDPQINFVWDNVPPFPDMDPHVFSVRWTGFIRTPETGKYLFRAHVDDGIRVYVDGKLVIDAWDMHDSERFAGEIQLSAGRQYALKVEYFNALLEGEIHLYWQLPSEAPVFGGLLGYNDHLIASSYLVSPTPPVVSKPFPSISTPAPPKPASPTIAKAKPSAATPAKKTPVTAAIAADTLERYIPKNILFEKSKSVMLPASAPELDNLANFLRRHPNYSLLVEGHTDKIGNAAKNMKLSQERAQTVADYLVAKGIQASRIRAQGYGDTRPLVREAPGVANPKNRRVAFVIQE